MEARIRQLQAMLGSAVIVERQSAAADLVEPGVEVDIRYEGDDATERFFVGSIEERREGVAVISPGSPLGLALLGHGPGETVEYEAPSGTLRVEIVRIG